MAQPRKLFLKVLDTLVYSVAVTLIVFVISAIIGFVVVRTIYATDGIYGTELVMFVTGWLILGYATILMRPKSRFGRKAKAKRKTTGGTMCEVGEEELTYFQRIIHKLPPLKWYTIDPSDCLSNGQKLFVSGVVVIAVSYLIERFLVCPLPQFAC